MAQNLKSLNRNHSHLEFISEYVFIVLLHVPDGWNSIISAMKHLEPDAKTKAISKVLRVSWKIIYKNPVIYFPERQTKIRICHPCLQREYLKYVKYKHA